MDIRDLTNLSPFRLGPMERAQGLVFHHTGGRGTPESIMNVFKQRGLATQYIMDRDGSVYRALPEGTVGRHIRPSEINDLSNRNALGIEVIAKDDSDWTDQQRAAANTFANYAVNKYGFPASNIYGHGELNSHKMRAEGMQAVAEWRKANGLEGPVYTAASGPAPAPVQQQQTQIAAAPVAQYAAPAATAPVASQQPVYSPDLLTQARLYGNKFFPDTIDAPTPMTPEQIGSMQSDLAQGAGFMKGAQGLMSLASLLQPKEEPPPEPPQILPEDRRRREFRPIARMRGLLG